MKPKYHHPSFSVAPPRLRQQVLQPLLTTETDVITGTASYSNLGYTETAVCYSIEAPIGRVVTVTNINNGRSITCTNVFSLLVPNGVTIILHTTVFIKLADLIDSPIPVKISW
jgi:hypothetical protein